MRSDDRQMVLVGFVAVLCIVIGVLSTLLVLRSDRGPARSQVPTTPGNIPGAFGGGSPYGRFGGPPAAARPPVSPQPVATPIQPTQPIQPAPAVAPASPVGPSYRVRTRPVPVAPSVTVRPAATPGAGGSYGVVPGPAAPAANASREDPRQAAAYLSWIRRMEAGRLQIKAANEQRSLAFSERYTNVLIQMNGMSDEEMRVQQGQMMRSMQSILAQARAETQSFVNQAQQERPAVPSSCRGLDRAYTRLLTVELDHPVPLHDMAALRSYSATLSRTIKRLIEQVNGQLREVYAVTGLRPGVWISD